MAFGPRPNPNTDRPNSASPRSTWSFHERYADDAEFKRQIDEARRRATEEQGTAALKASLEMTRGKGTKLY